MPTKWAIYVFVSLLFSNFVALVVDDDDDDGRGHVSVWKGFVKSFFFERDKKVLYQNFFSNQSNDQSTKNHPITWIGFVSLK